MFERLWGKRKDPAQPAPTTPEVMGLRLGGAFMLDDLKLRLIEPQLIVENVARTQLIQAVGQVQLDESSTVLRYYTDDDGFLQILLTGGMTEAHIADVKMWYFYDTQSIHDDDAWQSVLKDRISTTQQKLEGHNFARVWGGVTGDSPPVAMTEKTVSEGGSVSHTDQFAMLYERDTGQGRFEYVMLAGEEKIIDNRPDRCLVISTGFDIQQPDIDIVG